MAPVRAHRGRHRVQLSRRRVVVERRSRHHLRRSRGVEALGRIDGHGGGDTGIMRSFVAAIRGEAPPRSSARESLESHLLAFASEDSRLAHTVVDMPTYRQQLRDSVSQK